MEVETVKATGNGSYPGELLAAQICEKMGWTIQELRAQPDWFINDLILIS